MYDPADNPYEALDLDPRLDMASLTARLRERAEDLPSDRRGEVQGQWQKLTMNAGARARFAFLARPRVRRVDDLDSLLGHVREPPAGRVESAMLLGQLTPDDLAIPPIFDLTDVPAAPLDTPPRLAEQPLVDLLSEAEDTAR